MKLLKKYTLLFFLSFISYLLSFILMAIEYISLDLLKGVLSYQLGYLITYALMIAFWILLGFQAIKWFDYLPQLMAIVTYERVQLLTILTLICQIISAIFLPWHNDFVSTMALLVFGIPSFHYFLFKTNGSS